MDVEDLTEIMNALWERLDQTIINYGAALTNNIGDAVMALWGSKVVKEDDPEQAIRAALAMQQEISSFNAAGQFAVELRLRIGLNTGPVFLSTIGTTGEYTAIGDAVNIASRLGAGCPSGWDSHHP